MIQVAVGAKAVVEGVIHQEAWYIGDCRIHIVLCLGPKRPVRLEVRMLRDRFRFLGVLVSPGCYNKYHSLGGIDSRHLFLTVLEAEKSKIMMPVNLMSGVLAWWSKRL